MSNVITTIKIEITGYVNIDLTENDIKRIAEDYNGDYQSYIDNMEYSSSAANYSEPDKNYNSAPIEKALDKYKKENNLEDDFSIPNYIQMQRYLEGSVVPSGFYTDATANKKKQTLHRSKNLRLLVDVADTDNVKCELNYIYFDDENIVSCDTRRLAVVKNNTNLKDLYIPKFFLEKYLEDEDSIIEIVDKNIFLITNNIYCHYTQSNNIKYPDYKRIMPKDTAQTIEMDKYLSDMKIYTNDVGIDIALYKFNDNKHLVINNEYINRDMDTVSFNESNLPVVFERENVKLIVMPMILDADDIDELIKG